MTASTPLVLVLNSGSSSLKFAIIQVENGQTLLSGLAEKLGREDPVLHYQRDDEKHSIKLQAGAGHHEALKDLVEWVEQYHYADSLIAIGHRVVHGGEQFTESALIDEQVVAAIENSTSLAPLHGPANLEGIYAAQQAFANVPQIAVFDTAFHQSMPAVAYLYPLPYALYKQHGVRRYGFHGTSHKYVMQQALSALSLADDRNKLITAHLGNGCSVTAILNGKSVDTSMGMTPLEGVMMGTRSGDIDPGIVSFLHQHHQYSISDIDQLLNKESGLLGISELSNDMRTLEQAHHDGNPLATLAIDLFCYRLAKRIASYLVPLSGLDALIFTGGIGENSALVRAKVVEQLVFLGIQLDEQRNQQIRFGQAGLINPTNQTIKVMVIPTNEEWMISQDAARIAQEHTV